MANRNTLHIKHLESFREWLVSDGWTLEPTKGMYEAIRARKEGKKYPLIVYEKIDNTEHLSVLDRDVGIINAFLRERKNNTKL